MLEGATEKKLHYLILQHSEQKAAFFRLKSKNAGFDCGKVRLQSLLSGAPPAYDSAWSTICEQILRRLFEIFGHCNPLLQGRMGIEQPFHPGFGIRLGQILVR
jgi:hypothetical protein